MRARLHLPTTREMTAEQLAIHGKVLATRGNAEGPFLAWLRAPKFADPAQELGAVCRYGTSLSQQESEVLILYVAAHYECPAEQATHEPIAQRAGLSDAVLIAIRTDEVPPLATPRLRILAECARHLVVSKKLPQAVYERAVGLLGEVALVEAVGVIGYYALVAYTLNAFAMQSSSSA
jgi:4-carboxymuconolactone decarboxylase